MGKRRMAVQASGGSGRGAAALWLVFVWGVCGACEESTDPASDQPSPASSGAPVAPPDPPPVGPAPNTAGQGPGPSPTGSSLFYEFITNEIEIPAAGERYLCHTETLTEDLNIERFEYDAQPGVHHFLLARTLTPEQEGTFECNVLFRFSWVPVFGAGNGSQVLQLPPGSAQVLPAGTQLLIQLHLLNADSEPIREQVGIRLRKSLDPEPEPVGVYAFGTDEIELGAAGPGVATNDCTVSNDVTIFAALPHMHYLGQSLTLEVADAAGVFSEVYRREPWDFDKQSVEPFVLSLPAGTQTRTTCQYQNDTDKVVQFGESSKDEMCFLVTYQVGKMGLNGCVQFDPSRLGGMMMNGM